MSRSVFLAALVVVAVYFTCSTDGAGFRKRDLPHLFDKVSSLLEKITDKIKEDLKAATEKLGALGHRIKQAAEFLTAKLKELREKGAEELPVMRDELLGAIDGLLETVTEARKNSDLLIIEKIQLDIIITWLKGIEGVLNLIPGEATTVAPAGV